MEFSIHKVPTKVSLSGLFGIGLYFLGAYEFFRNSEIYYLVLGGGLCGLAMVFVRSVACVFISTFTVTDDAIETVTEAGGITRVRFDSLDWERSGLSDTGLLLAPHDGESIFLSIVEYSRRDIARLAEHVGIDSSEWMEGS